MRKRAKLIAERDRARKQLEHQIEQEKLVESYKELSTRTGGFARGGTADKKQLKRKAQEQEQLAKFGLRFHERPKSRKPVNVELQVKVRNVPRYSGEMAERELKAKQEYERMKLRIGPVGNKMGDQYLTDSDLADFKKGLLRRRS